MEGYTNKITFSGDLNLVFIIFKDNFNTVVTIPNDSNSNSNLTLIINITIIR